MAEKLYTQRKIKKSFLGLKSERPRAELGQALVLTGGGTPIVLQPGEQATSGEAAWGGYDTVYEVDMGKHTASITGAAHADDGIAEFQFNLSFSYRVNNPRQLIEDRIQDPDAILRQVLTETIRRVTSTHNIRDVQQATNGARAVLDKNQLSSKLPFELTDISLRLEVDSASKTIAKTRTDQEIARLQESHKQELERMQESHKQEIWAQRRAVYEEMADGGRMSALMQQLAQRPDDIAHVADILRQQDDRQRMENFEMLKAMLDKEMIQDHHLKDVIVNIVNSVYRPSGGGRPQLGAASRGQLTDASKPKEEGKQ